MDAPLSLQLEGGDWPPSILLLPFPLSPFPPNAPPPPHTPVENNQPETDLNPCHLPVIGARRGRGRDGIGM
jgi:hypothetical protein